MANSDLVQTGTRTSNSNTYHYTELTPQFARHQQTTLALPKAEIDGHMLLQEQTPKNGVTKQLTKSFL